jgi:hypothetical protein
VHDGRFVIGDLTTVAVLHLRQFASASNTLLTAQNSQTGSKFRDRERTHHPILPLNMSTDVLSSLPDDALKLICSYVSFKHRFTSCCLVNKRLHAAATAATGDMSLSFTADPEHPRLITPPHRDSALRWLSHQAVS